MNAALETARGGGHEPVRKRLLSVTDYHRMEEAGIFGPDERVELIEGEIIMTPPVGPAHAALVMRVDRLLVRAVGDRALVNVRNPIRLSNLSEPEPDLALLRPRDDFYGTAHPGPVDTLLAIEVADSTLAYDRGVKARLYARHGIPELWLVDVRGERLIAYTEPGEDGYAHEAERKPPDTLEPALLPGVSLDLSNLFGAS